MLAAGANFALYYALARRRNLQVLRDVEFRVYLGIAVAATAVRIVASIMALLRIGKISLSMFVSPPDLAGPCFAGDRGDQFTGTRS